MEICNKQIFGSDKDQWLKQTVAKKVAWIRKYTNQQDNAIIEEFVNNPKISKDKICLTCGDNAKSVKTKNIGIVDEEIVKPIKKRLKKQ